MTKKFRVKFNTTGFYNGQGIWEFLDEIAEIEASTAQEAIELAINWFVETDENYGEFDCNKIRAKYEDYAWSANELLFDEKGNRLYDEYNTPMYGKTEYRD